MTDTNEQVTIAEGLKTADFSLILASSVHDMKNSLGMLLNSLDTVMRAMPPQNEEQEQQFSTLHYEASRINTELIQLLSIYRMQNDRLPVQIDECYLIDVLEEQVARNDLLFQSRGLDVQIDCDEDLVWYFDGELIGGVVHNVLVNAARYTKKTIRLSARLEDELLEIAVADDGIGYPDAMMRAPEEGSMGPVDFQKGNTHLGLYFAQQVASLHRRNDRNGQIELSNGGDLGGGIFKIFLP
ncbi:HAMP domain-containing histidine kinase [Pseudomaricurvus alkylphenolicus]|jgi:signal transduction histidine kinase|uniref:sensor histidine kinase n=1 Tax=Pseudomaricurvus alkylphenolicus TaxID=1306991 RepID=UPI0014238724|nr:HAMP domain-containing sensor histidine kinase [Pseudomaricurvus alkylphenolicus]NIB44546.1 HAMP domain-containing histidine kinase [Pseudomaricurvus alkylphenolicus]